MRRQVVPNLELAEIHLVAQTSMSLLLSALIHLLLIFTATLVLLILICPIQLCFVCVYPVINSAHNEDRWVQDEGNWTCFVILFSPKSLGNLINRMLGHVLIHIFYIVLGGLHFCYCTTLKLHSIHVQGRSYQTKQPQGNRGTTDKH